MAAVIALLLITMAIVFGGVCLLADDIDRLYGEPFLKDEDHRE